MRRLMLAAGAAALLVGVGYGVAAITAPAPAAPHISGGQHHRRTTECGMLQDGVGHGSALSALPGKPVVGGQQATVQNVSNAWKTCFSFTSGAIWLSSSNGFCATDTDGIIAWDGCGQDGQNWTQVPQSGGGYEFRDETLSPGLDICPTDGVGSKVISSGRSGCSAYHRTFLFTAN
jgi:hypothetical protein